MSHAREIQMFPHAIIRGVVIGYTEGEYNFIKHSVVQKRALIFRAHLGSSFGAVHASRTRSSRERRRWAVSGTFDDFDFVRRQLVKLVNQLVDLGIGGIDLTLEIRLRVIAFRGGELLV